MEILREGKASGAMRFECSKCGCHFKAEQEEYKYIDCYKGMEYYECACPCCGEKCERR